MSLIYISLLLRLKANWSMDKMEVFLSSDSFYVEVKLAPNGSVKDVLLAHSMTGHPQVSLYIQTKFLKTIKGINLLKSEHEWAFITLSSKNCRGMLTNNILWNNPANKTSIAKAYELNNF